MLLKENSLQKFFGYLVCTLLIIACYFSTNAQSPINLLVNGSFENGPTGLGLTSLPGWTVTQGTIDVRSEPQQAPGSGSQLLELIRTPGVGGIQQSFSTVAGKYYMLVGWVAHHPGIRESGANIFVNGILQTPLYHNGAASDTKMRWQKFRRFFKAVSTTTTLKLVDQNLAHYDNGGIFLDGLRVSPAGPKLINVITSQLPSGIKGLAVSNYIQSESGSIQDLDHLILIRMRLLKTVCVSNSPYAKFFEDLFWDLKTTKYCGFTDKSRFINA